MVFKIYELLYMTMTTESFQWVWLDLKFPLKNQSRPCILRDSEVNPQNNDLRTAFLLYSLSPDKVLIVNCWITFINCYLPENFATLKSTENIKTIADENDS